MQRKQFNAIVIWQDETFPKATSLSKIEHLTQELIEVIDAINTNDPGKASEFADCIMLLYGAASKEGLSYDDICNAVADKFSINKLRKWGEPDKNGVVNHL